MSQQDILDFLEKNKNKWFTIKEISDSVNLVTIRLCKNATKLRKYNLVFYEKKQLPHTTTMRWFYKHKGE